MATGNGAARYTVFYPTDVSDQLQQWADRAAVIGQFEGYARALIEMRDRLSVRPLTWADWMRSAASPGDRVCIRYTMQFCVEYEVRRTAREVRVSRVFLLPGSPLA